MPYWFIPLLSLILSSTSQATVWEKMTSPTNANSESIGSYANGCLEGAVPLPLESEGYQVVRSERGRYYAHPKTVSFIQDLGKLSSQKINKQLLIADISLAKGGRFAHGHSSHQTGLDIDIWLKLLNKKLTKKQLAEPYSISLVDKNSFTIREKHWQDAHFELIKSTAKDERVARIFVNSVIKEKLCALEKNDDSWLRKVRPWWGHSAHMHVRLQCPKDDKSCIKQPEIKEGSGCGYEVESWRLKPTAPKKKAPAKVIPKQCSMMLMKK